MQRKVFFGKLPDSLAGVREARFGLLAPAVLLAVITTGVGVLAPFVLKALTFPISRAF
jgi:hypothetical protein